jgi:hypothetical protein
MIFFLSSVGVRKINDLRRLFEKMVKLKVGSQGLDFPFLS